MDFSTFPPSFTPDFSCIPHAAAVLGGSSGGADSLSLLLRVCAEKKARGIAVYACHVHHGLRGDEADGDAAFSADFCRRLEIPCRVVRLQLPDPSEESARKGRYHALLEEAKAVGAAFLLLAHNADDNLETALLNLSRGTGAAGLGMPPVREEDGITILRPLLGVPRAAIDAYVSACGVQPRLDATNLGDDYTRNRLRHHAIPAMRTVNARAVENAARALSHLREDEEFLASLADDLLSRARIDGGWDVHLLQDAPRPVLARALRSIFAAQDLSARHIDALITLCQSREGSRTLDLPGKRAVNAYGVLRMETVRENDVQTVPEACFPLREGESVCLPGSPWRVSAKKVVMNCDDRQSFHKFYVDSAAIHGILSVSTRRIGDAYVPYRRGHSVSLKKEMIARRIPASERGLIPVIRDEAGIVGVPGIGVADRCAAQGGDVIEIRFERI